MTRKYLNLLLELVSLDSSSSFETYVPTFMNIGLGNLIFTKEDAVNVKLEME